MVSCNVEHCEVVSCNVEHCEVVRCNVEHYEVVSCNVEHCEVVRCNVNHSAPFNAKAKTQCSYPATPLTYLNGANTAMFFYHFLTDK